MSRTLTTPLSTLRAFINEALRADVASLDEVGEKFTSLDILKLFSDSGSGSGSKSRGRNSSSSSGASRRPGEMSALVVGNSQLGSALGEEVIRRLEALGVNVDAHAPNNGGSSAAVADELERSLDGHKIAVAFIGGNNDTPNTATSALRQMHDDCEDVGAHLIVIGPPPATMITKLDSAQEVFSAADAADYQLAREEGKFASNRIEVARALEEEAGGMEGVSVYSVASHFSIESVAGSSDFYPDQPDGIHTAVGAVKIADAIFSTLGIAQIVSDLKTVIPEGGLISDIIKLPGNHELSPRQKEMVDIIEDEFTNAGYTRPVIIAAVVNAYAESKFDPNAHNKVREDSVGLFQLNRNGGAGARETVEDLKDPRHNAKTILNIESGPLRIIQAKANSGTSIENLVAEFTITVERPKDKVGDAEERRALYKQMFPGLAV
jgi:hypothetical protein